MKDLSFIYGELEGAGTEIGRIVPAGFTAPTLFGPCQGWGRGFEALRPLQISSRKLMSYEKVAARRPSSFLAWCPHGVHRDVEAPTNPLCGSRPRIPWSSESSDCRLGSRSGPEHVFRSGAIGARGERRRPIAALNKCLRTSYTTATLAGFLAATSSPAR
jgi:hypothetical protein